jgi:hypothetical protein
MHQAFDSFLPYYEKSPQFTPPTSDRAANATALYNADVFSSTGGPLQVYHRRFVRLDETISNQFYRFRTRPMHNPSAVSGFQFSLLQTRTR